MGDTMVFLFSFVLNTIISSWFVVKIFPGITGKRKYKLSIREFALLSKLPWRLLPESQGWAEPVGRRVRF